MSMTVNYLEVVAKDGQTAAERFAAMTPDSKSFYLVDGALYLGTTRLDNEALDTVSDVMVATKSGKIVTLGSIAEVNGIIQAGTAAGIDLAAVASTGKSEDVEYKAADGTNPAISVEDALDDIYDKIGSGGAIEDQIDAKIAELDSKISNDGDTDSVATTADVSTQRKVLTEITETDGKLTAGKHVVLKDVSLSGLASDVENTAITGVEKSGSATTNVQDTLEALKGLIDDVESNSAITVDEVTSGISDVNVLKQYKIYQGGTQTSGTTTGGKLISTLDIPKDYLLKSAEVKVVTTDDDPVTGYKEGQKYIDFVVNTVGGDGNVSHLYILIDDLVHPISGSTGAEITVSVDSTNSISATVNTIDGSKIVYKAESSTGAGDGETVKEALTRLDGTDNVTGSISNKIKDAIDGLDTTSDVSLVSVANDVVTITGSIKEENGIIATGDETSVTLNKVAKTGAAADVTVADTDSNFGTDKDLESVLAEIAGHLTWKEI